MAFRARSWSVRWIQRLNAWLATVDTASSTCDDDGANLDDEGTCTIVFTSPTVGNTVGNGSVTLHFGDVDVERATNGNAGPGGSGPATKEWFDNPPPLPRTGTDSYQLLQSALLLLLAGAGFVGAGWYLRPAGAHASRPFRRRR